VAGRRVWLVERAVELAALAAVTSAVYVIAVVGVGGLVGGGDQSRMLTLAATIAVAVSFPRVRPRARRLARQLAQGDQGAEDKAIVDLSRRLSGMLVVDDVLPAVADVGARLVRGRIEVHLAPASGNTGPVIYTAGVEATSEVPTTVEVVHDGSAVGTLVVWKPAVDPLTPSEERLLRMLANQAAVAFANVRLTAELRGRLAAISEQAEELRASRTRLIVARDDERRRLERLINQHVQRELTQVARWVTVASRLAAADPEAAAGEVGRAEVRAAGALEALRDLARGVFPALLEEKGLVAALETHYWRQTDAVRIVAADDLRGRRHAPDVEAAAYFCCTEAVRVVQRARRADVVTVALSESAGSLEVTITAPRPPRKPGVRATVEVGDALAVVADRIAALEGSLTITTPRDGSTHVRALLPVAKRRRVRARARSRA
jgi:signal transduction histidine kinase